MEWSTPSWGSGGSRDGTVERVLTSHQCGPGLNTGVDTVCGLSLLFFSLLWRFFAGFAGFPRFDYQLPFRKEQRPDSREWQKSSLHFPYLHNNQNCQIPIRSVISGWRVILWICHCTFVLLFIQYFYSFIYSIFKTSPLRTDLGLPHPLLDAPLHRGCNYLYLPSAQMCTPIALQTNPLDTTFTTTPTLLKLWIKIGRNQQ